MFPVAYRLTGGVKLAKADGCNPGTQLVAILELFLKSPI